MKLNNAIEKIEGFRTLNYNNWNGYNAEPISDKLIDKSIELIKQFKITPLAFPTGRKSIQFEWESNDEFLYLEIEIFEDIIKTFKMTGNNEESEECTQLNNEQLEKIEDYVSEIFQRNKTS